MSSGKGSGKRNRWLELIAAYKLIQAGLLVAAAVGALRLLHRDVADLLNQLAEKHSIDTQGRFISMLLDKASLVDDKMLRRISALLFGYALIGLVEGIGLYLEKVWAEWFTSLVTASFLPWEVMELMHRVTWFRVGILIVNLGVLAYLIGHLIRRKPLGNAVAESNQ